ncbi:unnamed protein product [Pleuronectes platessa]|uniref:Uncharacterized protein n=1 Tax=Pleuronectes platessa TaxID=8262 RepID=A0A9N7VWL4_PLEPL|nr:unnamed protein product [Pleuronectes platessa]
MVRSCPATWPERAEQWSRSADGAAEGKTSRSVSRAEQRGSLRPLRSSPQSQGGAGDKSQLTLDHNLDRSPAYRRAKQPVTLAFTPTIDIESPVNLTAFCMSLEKSE